MDVAGQKRLLNWLSQLEEAEPVIPQQDNHPCARFTFEGIPIEKQTTATNGLPPAIFTAHERVSQAGNDKPTSLEPEGFVHPYLATSNKRKAAGSGITRKEKNGYERIPRSKTRDDRYEYKGTSSRIRGESATRRQKKKQQRQKRKHIINQEFHASNVPRNRLTLHTSMKLGIFNRGKTSSPVNPRVLDVGFSEAEFLSKRPEQKEDDRPQRQAKRQRTLDFGTKFNMEESTQPHLQSTDVAFNRDDTAIYHESENCSLHTDVQTQSCDLRPNNDDIWEKGLKEAHEKVIPSQSAQNEPAQISEYALESYTMQLLNFNLHEPDKLDAIDQTKKYWTLEELKYLLQKRVSSRSPQEKGSLEASTPHLQRYSQEYKYDRRNEGKTVVEELPREKRIHGVNQILESDRTSKSATPDSHAMAQRFYSIHDDLTGGTTPDHRTLPSGEAGCALEGGLLQPQRPYLQRETSLRFDEDTSLISQGFDAAYEAIMRSEWDTLHDTGYAPMESHSVGNNGHVLALQEPCESAFEDDTLLRPSHVGQEALPSHGKDEPVFETTEPRDLTRAPLRFAESYADGDPLFSIERDIILGLEPAGTGNPDVRGLSLNINPGKDFWRQNKLY